jgi:hypothetical protein
MRRNDSTGSGERMNFHAADAIVRAVLYEGYLLYPYRPTAIKNRQRWSFGGLYPAAAHPWAQRSCTRSACSRHEREHTHRGARTLPAADGPQAR